MITAQFIISTVGLFLVSLGLSAKEEDHAPYFGISGGVLLAANSILSIINFGINF